MVYVLVNFFMLWGGIFVVMLMVIFVMLFNRICGKWVGSMLGLFSVLLKLGI